MSCLTRTKKNQVKPTYLSNLAVIAILLTLTSNLLAEERLRQSEPDSFVKLGDIKGEYRSGPEPYVKLGDIKGEYKTEPSKEEQNDLLWEYEYLIWGAEGDDFFWGRQQRRPIDVLDRLIWAEEAGDF